MSSLAGFNVCNEEYYRQNISFFTHFYILYVRIYAHSSAYQHTAKKGDDLIFVAKLEEENRLLLKIIDSSYDGMLIADDRGLVQYCNDAYLRISGLQRERIIGRSLEEMVQAKEIPDACSPNVIRSRKPETKVIEYYNGVSALVTSTPVFADEGHLIHIFSNIRDITELIKLQEKLKSTTDLNTEYQHRLWQIQLNSPHGHNLVAKSPVMQNIFRLALRIAYVNSPVLIQGESGVGKDELARYIHYAGESGAEAPFIHINCSAIPETLLESELFGYEAGAFTGAVKGGKRGMFELANGGSLYLDEIGEMPLSLQVKILDVLQKNTIYRLGGTKTVKINTRIIAATNSNLEEKIAANLFRKDLYYRLNVIPIYIPPLREHQEDIEPLVIQFLDMNNKNMSLKKRMTPQAYDILSAYSWPGNIRELKNVVERMIVLTDGDIIDDKCIPTYIRQALTPYIYDLSPQVTESWDLKSIIERVEEEVIKKAITDCGSMRKAALQLGIDLSTLVRKKRKYKTI